MASGKGKKAALRPVYTSAQIEQYLDYVQFPKDVRITRDKIDTPAGLEFANQLVKYQLAKVPFENFDLHYSQHRSISLDVDHLFHKIVERAVGRGGYCMENNTLFGTILRSLGYQVMPAGARVSSGVNMTDDSKRDDIKYTGFTHTVNIVTIAGTKYFTDVGFGNRGPTSLIPLTHGVKGRSTGDQSGGNWFQITKQHLNVNTHFNDEQLMWIYSVRFNPDMQYIPIYCFSELEFLPQDFQVASFYVSKSPTSFFTYMIVCTRFLVEGGEVVGDVTLNDKVIKERRFGQSKTLAQLTSEKQRVDALKKFFNITLSPAEVRGINGMMSAIV